MGEEEDITPFWLQTNNRRRGGRRISFIFFNSGVFLVVLVVIAFVLVFVVIPSFLHLASQIFRPHLIKKGWDSLNLVLVLFAIICGFLSRNTDQNNDSYSTVQQEDDRHKSYPSTPRRWYEYNQDRTGYGSGSNSLSRLRSFSSYPDLRQESLWVGSGEARWKFYDDTHLKNYHPLPNHESDQLDQEFVQHDPRQRGQDQVEQTIKVQRREAAAAAAIETKDIAVDTFVTKQQEVKDSETPTAPVSPQFPAPPPAPAKSQMAVKRKVKRTYHDLGNDSGRKEVPVKTFHSLSPPSPPPPPPPPPTFGKNEKRRGKDILNSIRKKKKQRQKSVENLDTFFDPPPATSQSLFPPPSPPPPPPPPPPFKMPAWKFVRDEDFVRVESFNSSRSEPPDLDSLDDLSSDKESPVAAVKTGTATALFCPSPDVNTKADNFIARFRAGLKLEKINSVKARSNLGPTTNDTEGAGPS